MDPHSKLMEMENHFFGNHWNANPPRRRYVPSTMEVPVPIQRRTVPVFSIPVRFVESKNRSDSATKIQKVFRGFMARKSMKKVAAIETEVSEIEKTLSNESAVESIRRDRKVRVSVGEMLMNLVLRLDSVKGVDSGIRNFRKAVIKKAIALQEKVDSISEFEVVDRNSEVSAASGARGEQILDHEDVIILPEHKNNVISADDCKFDVVESIPSSIVPEISVAGDENLGVEVEEEVVGIGKTKTEKKKMMEMMEQLFEQNEVQTKMLCSLSHKVEQLEKAFLYETLRRKKKKKEGEGEGEEEYCQCRYTSEKYPKTQKCDTLF